MGTVTRRTRTLAFCSEKAGGRPKSFSSFCAQATPLSALRYCVRNRKKGEVGREGFVAASGERGAVPKAQGRHLETQGRCFGQGQSRDSPDRERAHRAGQAERARSAAAAWASARRRTTGRRTPWWAVSSPAPEKRGWE